MHVLFGVTVGVPTAVVVLTRPPGMAVTLLLVAAFVAWYVTLVGGRPAWHGRGSLMLVYAGGALALYTALTVREGGYVILLYALLPQFFSLLARWAAVTGVVGIVLLPATVTGDLGGLLTDPDGLFNLLANVGLGLAVTAVMQAFGERSAEQQETIAALERARADNERLLARARRDLRDRDAVAGTGHALVAARSADEVVAALVEHLGRHSAGVRGAALLSGSSDGAAEVLVTVPGTASPPVGAAVTVPDLPAAEDVALVPAGALSHDARSRLGGVAAVAVLRLRLRRGHGQVSPPGTPALLWVGTSTAADDAAVLRDLSTVATATAFALSNLKLAAHAAAQGRTAGVLAERQRLAHEIHDTLAQGFTSVITQLEATEAALDDDRMAAAMHLDRARRTARDSLTEARRTVAALRPQPLDDATLSEAVRAVVDRWGRAHPSVDLSLSIDGAASPVAADAEAALVRVTQEALANVARHARAGGVEVTLSFTDDLVLLDVTDDGVGFDTTRTAAGGDISRGGYGLTAMRERMRQVGGRLVVESRPGNGTSVAASVGAAPPPTASSSGASGKRATVMSVAPARDIAAGATPVTDGAVPSGRTP